MKLKKYTPVFTYTFDTKKASITITGLNEDYRERYGLTIPNTIAINDIAYPVIAIGPWAFCEQGFSGTLTLPDNLETIGMGAFRDNQFTWALTLNKNITKIGTMAFYNNQFNNILTLPKNLEKMAI